MNPLVVIDTNVWISGLFWHGTPTAVVDQIEAEEITPCFSFETLGEWEEKVLHIAKAFHRIPVYVTYRQLIARRAVLVEPEEHVAVCRDPKDNQFLDVTIASSASFLVTGDKDLLSLKTFRTTRIFTPRQFLDE